MAASDKDSLENIDKLLAAWKTEFDQRMVGIEELHCEKIIQISKDQDEVLVEIERIKFKVEQLETSLVQFKQGSHVTQKYFDVQQSKIELQEQLDSIQFWDQENLKEERSELHDRLNLLVENLNSKIHPRKGGDGPCPQCEEQIVIVPTL